MSGGHFDYQQHRLADIADEIEEIIENNDSKKMNKWGDPKGRGYSLQTIERFRVAVEALRMAERMAQRVDWLLSGDDNEESFHQRWEEEIKDRHQSWCEKMITERERLRPYYVVAPPLRSES